MRPPRQFESTLEWLRRELPNLPNQYGQLPTERELAKMRGASVATLRKALSVLKDEGLLERRQGKGTFVCTGVDLESTGTTHEANGEGSTAAKTIGVLISGGSRTTIPRTGIYRDVYRGLLNASEGLEMAVSIGSYDDEDESSLRRFVELAETGRVDACLLLAITDPRVHRAAAATGLPAIVVDHWPAEGVAMDSVDTASELDAAEVVKILHHMGHERIAFIDRENPELNPHRRLGYEQGLREVGLPPRADYVVQCRAHPDKIVQAMRTWMKLDQPPTAIITHDIGQARTLMSAAEVDGLEIPGDLSVVGFAGMDDDEGDSPVSRVATDFERMGVLAVERLHARLQVPSLPVKRIHVPGQFFMGKTAAPPKTPAQ